MSDKNVKRPYLILPYRASETERQLPDESMLALPPTKTPQLKDWARVITQDPNATRNFMDSFESPTELRSALEELRRDLSDTRNLNDRLIQGKNKLIRRAANEFKKNGFVDLTTMPAPVRAGLFYKLPSESMELHFITDDKGRVRVELHRVENNVDASWMLSTLASLGAAGKTDLRSILTDREVADSLLKGAKIMIVPDGALAVPPVVIHSSMDDGINGHVPSFSVRTPGETAAVSSALALVLDGSRERIRVKSFLDGLVKSAEEAWAEGKTPTAFWDLDGTLFNARKFTTSLFKEWLEIYDGPLVDKIRTAVEEHEKMNGPIAGWNGKTILMDLGIDDADAQASALAYHNANFFNPQKRVEWMKQIPGTMQFARLLTAKLAEKGIPLRNVFVSLRSDDDDLLPNGKSSAELSLRAAGFWDENSIRLFWNGGKIDWSLGAGHEPNKKDSVGEFLLLNPDTAPILLADNTANHLNGYAELHELIGNKVPRLHIQGDAPPNSAPVQNGTFTIKPEQLEKEVAALAPNGITIIPKILKQPAFAPLLEKIMAAKSDGKTPIVIMDLDDTSVLTSARTKIVFQKFLQEWAETHPDDRWAIDLADEMRPSRIEYSIRDVIRDVGLDGLGIEAPFTKYFNDNFLSSEHLTSDPVREGVVEFLHDLKSLGVNVVYLTGRVRSTMYEGTMGSLIKNGFPIFSEGAELVMREDMDETDVAFKARILHTIEKGNGRIVATCDNEPDNLLAVRRQYPGSLLYLVGTKHAPNAAMPPPEAIFIEDFNGGITPNNFRKKPSLADQLRLKGSAIAEKLNDRSLTGGRFLREQLIARMNAQADTESLLLFSELAHLDTRHPTHRQATSDFNSRVGTSSHAAFDRILNFAGAFNVAHNTTFVPLRGPMGLERVLDLNSQNNSVANLDMFDGPQPTLKPLTAVDNFRVPMIPDLVKFVGNYPNIHDSDLGLSWERLVLGGIDGRYARTDLMAGIMTSTAMNMFNKSAGELRVVQHDAGIAFGSLLAFSRLGVKETYWHESTPERTVQTQYALAHLPPEYRGRLLQADDIAAKQADISIHANPTNHASVADLAGTARLVMLQTTDPDTITAPDGWELSASHTMQPWEYTLPTTMMTDAPMTFQVWMNPIRAI